MNVKVVSITKSLVDGIELSPEELIVYTARVSNPSNQMNTETADKLLKYLITNKHWSPLDMVDFAVEVKTSRAIAAQILRHWSFDFQEFSQRYAEAVDLEPIQIREAGSTTRQGSKIGQFDPEITIEYNCFEQEGLASEIIEQHLEYSVELYKALLEAGVAKECARMVLPLTTQTTIYMKASVRSWLFYLSQRLDPHAQLEHRELAAMIFDVFKIHFPNVVKAFFEAND
jgi:thymidylate synthase (FAD)